jgi:malonate decarboxylase delta subunit
LISPPPWTTAWSLEALFNRLNLINGLPAGKLIIHDFGATPGVARIRIEQVFEEVSHA